MHIFTSRLAVTGVLLTGSSLAVAHGGDHSGSSLYHYFANPDHIAIFSLVALAALGVATYFKTHTVRSTRARED